LLLKVLVHTHCRYSSHCTNPPAGCMFQSVSLMHRNVIKSVKKNKQKKQKTKGLRTKLTVSESCLYCIGVKLRNGGFEIVCIH